MIKETDYVYPVKEEWPGMNLRTHISTELLKGMLSSEAPEFTFKDPLTAVKRALLFTDTLISELNNPTTTASWK